MISANDAINIATTKEMNEVEQRFFDLLCLFTDYWIKEFFNGEDVSINIENITIRTNEPLPDKGDLSGVKIVPNGKYHNGVTGAGRMPWWRQKIVIQNWVEAYEKCGWKISTGKMKYPDSGYGEYIFKPDVRDIKLEKLGI